MELYKKLGFSENPFSTFSAEDEKKFLNKIYINPLFFETLKSDLSKGHSRFILGARGIGKTALILQLSKELKNANVFSIIIDDFENIPAKNNEVDVMVLIIERLITSYCIQISKTPEALKKLKHSEKEKLSFIIKEFFQTLSRTQYEKMYNKATNYKTRNFFRNCWNYIFNRPVNFLLTGGIEIVGDTVRNSFGLPPINERSYLKNYLPEIPLEKIEREKTPEKFLKNYKALKEILNDLCEIINSSGFSSTVIFFDKIDEYTKLNSGVSAVSEFLENFLKDTTVLMNSSYSLVFSLWEVVKPDLTNKGVRFDKIKPLNISWQPENLREITNKRIKYFSQNRKNLDSIILDPLDVQSIISLSNNSPRFLFRQLSYIYDQQAEIDSTASFLSKEAIKKGQLVYSKGFEYYAIYPTRRGSKEDILTNINRLLRIGKKTIMTKDFVDVFKVSTPAAISYIKIVQEYNLVKEMTETEGRAKIYSIVDPVIVHLIDNRIREIQK